MSVDDMVERGELERVVPDEAAAGAALKEARLHLESARAIAATDPNGAYQLAYDAARKIVVSEMRRNGLRVGPGEGSHMRTVAYARSVLDDDLGRRLNVVRGRRNTSEYGTIFFTETEVLDAIELATALAEIVG